MITDLDLAAPTGWTATARSGTATELHGLDLPDVPDDAALAWFLEATAPALVLGSTEPEDHADAELLRERGVELVRRRSGGGAVLVEPASCTWLDLVIPKGHDLWVDDVGRAMHWVGELWQSAFADLGLAAEVHRGPMRPTEWSTHVCFAGLGPGEVVDGDGRKVVGISQRRTRDAARFQTVAYHRRSPTAVAELLRLEAPARAALVANLDRTAVASGLDAAALRDALVRHLPV